MPNVRLQGPVNSGLLRTPITIQYNAAAGTYDSRGGKQEDWQTWWATWAQVVPSPHSREINAAQQMLAQQWWDVMVRYRDGITPAMRIVVGSRTLDIQSVMDPDQQRHRLVLYCLERYAAGSAA